jgi:hypothetical protein
VDGSRFDSLARSFARHGNRRRFVGGLVAASLGLFGVDRAGATRPGTLSNGAHCRYDADCKSGYCVHNPKLRPQASGTCRCRDDAGCPPAPSCHAVACEEGICVRTKSSGTVCTTPDGEVGTCHDGHCDDTCRPDSPAESCAGGVVSNCGDGSCACVENLDGGRTCVQRSCDYVGVSCQTGADCPTGVCISAPGCCGPLTPFCGVPCAAASGASVSSSTASDAHRWR